MKSEETNHSLEQIQENESEFNLTKSPEVVDSIAKETNVERRKPQDGVETEVQYKEVPVEQLTLKDLTHLGPEGKQFLKDMFDGLSNDRTELNLISYTLESSFNKTLELLAKEFPNASLQEVLQLGEDQLKAKVKSVLPKELPFDPEDVKYTEEIKDQLKDSLSILEYNINEYARSKKIVLAERDPLTNFGHWAKKRLVGLSEAEQQLETEKEQLLKQLEFLEELKNRPKITKADLDHEIRYLDKNHHDPDKQAGVGPLSHALEYSTLYVPQLTEYIKKIRDPEKIIGRVVQKKVVTIFKMIVDGYGSKPFNEEDSLHQLNTGTAMSPGGANFGYLDKGYIKKITVAVE